MTRRLKQGEYGRFVDWYAAMPDIRKREKLAKTQKQLAQELGVSEVVLSNWKDKETFEEDIKRARLIWTKSLTSEVIWALYRRATGDVDGKGKSFKGGRAEDVQLWMDWVEPGWNRKDGQYEPREADDEEELV